MALRRIADYRTDDVLRKKSKYVDGINEKIIKLLDDMAETMYQAKGVGLAAPQVGILKRAIVVDIGKGLVKLINPEIVEQEGEQQDIEGCLSIPGIVGEVVRPHRVMVKALNENGKIMEVEGSGLLARALCHEIDHLDGVLFIDKIVAGTKKMFDPSATMA
jgi:peptide deformylase